MSIIDASTKFRDDDVYTMLYLYHSKGTSLEALARQFSTGKDVLLGFVEGRFRRECYENYKALEKLFRD